MNDTRNLHMVSVVLRNLDDLVAVFTYKSKDGAVTNRAVSPYKLIGQHSFMGLCLLRGEVRTFLLASCEDMKIGLACDFLACQSHQIE